MLVILKNNNILKTNRFFKKKKLKSYIFFKSMVLKDWLKNFFSLVRSIWCYFTKWFHNIYIL